MPAHPEFTARFRASIFAGGVPPGVTARAPDEAERRFAVYRNNVLHGLTQALRQRFPVVERLVGPAFFAAMARLFIKAHPPENPVLLGWGTAMPDFLAAFPPVAHLPYMPDLARLEIARGQAYHAADAAPADPAGLRDLPDPGALRLVLHPSVRLVASPHAVVSIWQANQPGAVAHRVTAAGPEWALVGRTPSLEVIVEPIDRATHDLIDAFSRGLTLGEAVTARPDTDPTPALALLLRHGLISRIETGDPE